MKIRVFIIGCCFFALFTMAGANDEPWSGPQKIVEIQTGHSKTQFKLTDGDHFYETFKKGDIRRKIGNFTLWVFGRV